MPVHMCVALMAAQGHQLYALCREGLLRRLGYVVDYAGHLPEQFVIPGTSTTWPRRNDSVPEQRWILAEECQDAVITVQRLMDVVWMAAQIGTNNPFLERSTCVERSYFGIVPIYHAIY